MAALKPTDYASETHRCYVNAKRIRRPTNGRVTRHVRCSSDRFFEIRTEEDILDSVRLMLDSRYLLGSNLPRKLRKIRSSAKRLPRLSGRRSGASFPSLVGPKGPLGDLLGRRVGARSAVRSQRSPGVPVDSKRTTLARIMETRGAGRLEQLSVVTYYY